MFVDASAIIGIIADEDDRLLLSAKLAGTTTIYVSPIVYYEAAAGLARKRACPIDEAEALVALFLEETSAEMIPVGIEIALAALAAFHRFGNGRHPADLNMGDCFAYACSRAKGVPLLFKGNDFMATEVRACL